MRYRARERQPLWVCVGQRGGGRNKESACEMPEKEREWMSFRILSWVETSELLWVCGSHSIIRTKSLSLSLHFFQSGSLSIHFLIHRPTHTLACIHLRMFVSLRACVCSCVIYALIQIKWIRLCEHCNLLYNCNKQSGFYVYIQIGCRKKRNNNAEANERPKSSNHIHTHIHNRIRIRNCSQVMQMTVFYAV